MFASAGLPFSEVQLVEGGVLLRLEARDEVHFIELRHVPPVYIAAHVRLVTN